MSCTNICITRVFMLLNVVFYITFASPTFTLPTSPIIIIVIIIIIIISIIIIILYIYIHIHTHTHTHIYTYIHIYLQQRTLDHPGESRRDPASRRGALNVVCCFFKQYYYYVCLLLVFASVMLFMLIFLTKLHGAARSRRGPCSRAWA